MSDRHGIVITSYEILYSIFKWPAIPIGMSCILGGAYTREDHSGRSSRNISA